jgi:hypothetical protein
VKKSLVRKCRNELPSLRNSVHFDLDPYEWTHLQDLVNEKKTKLIEIITAVHRKKLLKLSVLTKGCPRQQRHNETQH